MINKSMPRTAAECKRCCGVFPQIIQPDGRRHEYIIVCPTCGKKTRPYREPWIAAQAWDCRDVIRPGHTRKPEQLTFLG